MVARTVSSEPEAFMFAHECWRHCRLAAAVSVARKRSLVQVVVLAA